MNCRRGLPLHHCGGGICGNKERASKVLYVYLAWRVDRWKTEEHMRVSPLACAVMPWGGGGVLGLAWDVAVMMLYRAPPRPRGRRPRGLIWTALGGCRRAERRRCRERRRGVQKPLAACQAKTVPGAVLQVAVGQSVPGGPPRPPRWEIPEANGGGRAAPDPG